MTPRSDIYSAGVVLYEMITGRLPYEGDSPVSVAIQHINSIPLSPREIDPEIPEALEAITMKAMASRRQPALYLRRRHAGRFWSELHSRRPAHRRRDEPTQVLGANTPHNVKAQPAHSPRTAEEEEPRRPSPRPRKSQSSRRRERYRDTYDEYEDGERREDKGSRLPVFLAIGAIVVFLIAIVAFLWVSFLSPMLGTGEESYSVPNLLGHDHRTSPGG